MRLEQRGSYDVLIANRGDVPRNVRIRFTPFTKGLQDDYTPALQFTDGSVALYIAQFDAFPMASVARRESAAQRSQQPDGAGREAHVRVARSGGAGLVARQAAGGGGDRRQGHLRVLRVAAAHRNSRHGRLRRSAIAGVDPRIACAGDARHPGALHAGAWRSAGRQAHHHAELGRPDARAHQPRGQRVARPHRAHLRRLRRALGRRGGARRRPAVHRPRGRAFLAGADRRLRIRARRLDHRRRRRLVGHAAHGAGASRLRLARRLQQVDRGLRESHEAAWNRDRAQSQRNPRLLRLRRGLRAGRRKRLRQVLLHAS